MSEEQGEGGSGIARSVEGTGSSRILVDGAGDGGSLVVVDTTAGMLTFAVAHVGSPFAVLCRVLPLGSSSSATGALCDWPGRGSVVVVGAQEWVDAPRPMSNPPSPLRSTRSYSAGVMVAQKALHTRSDSALVCRSRYGTSRQRRSGVVRKCCDAVDMVGSSGMGSGLYSAQVSKAEEEKGEEVLYLSFASEYMYRAAYTTTTPELFHSRPGTVSRVASIALQARAAVHGMVRLATVASSGQMLLHSVRGHVSCCLVVMMSNRAKSGEKWPRFIRIRGVQQAWNSKSARVMGNPSCRPSRRRCLALWQSS